MQLKNYAKTELILAVNKQAFTDSVPAEGYTHNPSNYDITLHNLRYFTVIAPRCYLEEEPYFVQYLPYIVISKMVDGQKKYFTYQRTKLVGEERLAGNISIGIGGHVELTDIVLDQQENNVRIEDTISRCISREVAEEISFQMDAHNESKEAYFQGFIMDNTDEVGKVHLGMVFEIFLQDSNVEASCVEEELNTLGFNTLEEIVGYCEENNVKAENWTKLYLKSQAERKEAGEELFYTPVSTPVDTIADIFSSLNVDGSMTQEQIQEAIAKFNAERQSSIQHEADILDAQVKHEDREEIGQQVE